MLIDTKHMVSVTEAAQNFPKVSKMVDETGMAIIMKKNVPTYVLTLFDSNKTNTYYLPDDEALAIAKTIIKENAESLEALAK